MTTHAHELTDREIAVLERIAKRSNNLLGSAVHCFLSGCVKKGLSLRVAGAALCLLILQTAVKSLMMCSRVPPDELPMDEITAIASDMQELMAKRVNDTIRNMEKKHVEGN